MTPMAAKGAADNSVIVPSVPSGQYYLRVEPEMARGSPFVAYDLRIAAQRAQLWLLLDWRRCCS